MFLPYNDQCIDSNAHHDGGNTVQHVSSEAHDVAELSTSVFREIDPRANAQWNADGTCDGEDHRRADDSIGHAAAALADRLGYLREERKIHRADAAVNQITEDCEQRREHEGGRDPCQGCGQMVNEVAEVVSRAERIRHWPSQNFRA